MLQKYTINKIKDLLKVISTREMKAKEISDYFGVHYVTVYRWIRVLNANGYDVVMRKRGKDVFYSVQVKDAQRII